MDKDAQIPRSLIDECFELGIMGVEIPEEHGGAGATFFMSTLVVEELARVDASVAVLVDVQNTLVNNALLRWGNEDQKARYFPKLAASWVGAYALSEAGSGSDAFALACRATDRGDHFELTGRKLWITNAAEAELFIVLATVDPAKGYKGITAFLVERTFAGFQVGKKEDKLGIRASSTCELILEGCRVPRANVLGEVGKGYKIAIETLNEGRIGIGAQMVGLAQGAFEHGLRYAQERQQFGKAIVEFQAVQFQLAELATEIEAARLLVYNAARLRDVGIALRQGGGDGQALRLPHRGGGRLEGDRDLRRVRLHPGVPGGEVLPRPEGRARSTRAPPTCSSWSSPSSSWARWPERKS